MSHTMTCWKEIARYLGKGVRTVQRWEHQMGLPVRRPHGREKSVLLAHSDELDAWRRSYFKGEPGKSQFDALRKDLADLRKQNALLRAKLEMVERTPTFVLLSGPADIEEWRDEVLLRRCSRAVQRNNAIRQKSLHIIEVAYNMQELLGCRRNRIGNVFSLRQFNDHLHRW